MLETIITTLLTSGLVSGLVSLIFNHKSQVRINSLQAQLARQTLQYSKVFETTEKTIVTLYHKLLMVETVFYLITAASDVEFNKEKDKHLDTFGDFKRYYRQNKLYIPKDTAVKIDAFITAMFDMEFDLFLTDANNWKGQRNQIIDKINAMLESLTNDFQNVLGFPSEKTDNP